MKWIEIDNEEQLRQNEKLENMEKCLYLIKEEIKGWDTETPENWANILTEVQRFLEELESV